MKKCPKCGREFENANTLCPADGTVLQKTEDPLIGQTLASKYRIEELINEGGMGAVYRATHVLMDKIVALKVLHPALAADDKIVARFTREAKAASRISHPHALTVTDFGEDESGVVFLVMEYLKGRTLKEVIHGDEAMPLPRVVEIIRQVCGALEAAHAVGVVHRDLKSDNIMLLDMGGGDWAKVLDFGIAKITEKVGQDPALTAPNLIIGTPQYMSPEQCSQAAEIDSRSDVYSLGVILYEMLVGHVPFTGESPTAIMMKHLQEPPPSVLEERKDLPAAVGRVVARALAKRPEDRYQTVAELAEELAAAAEGEPAAKAAATAGTPERATNRIVVTTGSNEAPRNTHNEDYDEATVVRAREEKRPAVVESEILSIAPDDPALAAAAPSDFNPWRIMIPAVAGLLVVFAVVYALTRNSASSGPTTNDNTQPLTIDPAGSPVQPAGTPTGEDERNIAPSATPTPDANDPNAQPGANVNTNVGPPTGGETENRNARPANENTEETPEPSPSPTKNNNQRQDLPPPRNTPTPEKQDDEPPPPPKPTPNKEATPKPTLPPPSTEKPSGTAPGAPVLP
ncbi:MAG TPA: protein kinase [Pyrinomonadaceae bacterium]|jgi:serine/threonine-protein kinase